MKFYPSRNEVTMDIISRKDYGNGGTQWH